MTITKRKTLDIIPILQKGKTNSYRPEDIKRWGVNHFMDVVCAKEDILIPNLGFTDEENKRMDAILLEETKNHDF
jgi:hypothetical protein